MNRYLPCLLLFIAGNLRADEPAKVAVVFESGKDSTPAQISVSGLGKRALSSLAMNRKNDADAWSALVRVHVNDGKTENFLKLPVVLGTWRVAETQLTFEPRFPFLAGTTYRVIVAPALLDPAAKIMSAPSFDLKVPAKDLTPVTKLTQIYPTRNDLPENQLRFYLHFSQPMTRGEALDHVRLLDGNGKVIEAAFLELGQELWDADMKRITMLFDPGRVKKELVPREEQGPILESGKKYTLVVSGKWKDAEGRELVQKEFRKNFTAGPADEEPVDPKKWKLIPPPASTKTPFQVRFNESLDHGLLNRVVWIVDADGKKVPGTVEVAEEETLWKFIPEQAWKPGKYQLVANTILEDLAANRIGRAFEVDIFRPIPKMPETKTVELGFEIKK